MQPIIVDPRALRARDRMIKKHGAVLARSGSRLAKRVYVEDDEYEPQYCLEGIAIVYDEPYLTNTGDIIVPERGCLDEHFAKRARTEFWVGHDSEQVLSNPTTEIEFIEIGDTLAFRMPLTNNRNTTQIREMVQSGKQAAISVGLTRTKERKDKVGSHTVIYIESADLRELSACAEGSCDQAFARFIDANHNPPLKDSVNSFAFKLEHGMHNLKVQGKKNRTQLEALKDRISVLQAGLHTQHVMRSITANESNRLQTERYDLLQAERRATLGM